jgi:hypothetical protein
MTHTPKPSQQYLFQQGDVFAMLLRQERDRRDHRNREDADPESPGGYWADFLAFHMPADYNPFLELFPYERHVRDELLRLFVIRRLDWLQALRQAVVLLPQIRIRSSSAFDQINDRVDRIPSKINTLA